MSNIQNIHALEERIYDIVQDYVDDLYNKDDVLAISKRCGKILLTADVRKKIKVGNTTEIYPFITLVRPSDNGHVVPDNDKISDIANSWVFIG